MDRAQVPRIAAALGAAPDCTPLALIAHLRQSPLLNLRVRCEQQIARECLLLSAQRLEARALARIAYRAVVDPQVANLSAWFDQQVEQSTMELITEDLLFESSIPADEPTLSLARCLGLESRLAHRACAQINLMPPELRHACRRLFIDATSFRACAEELGLTQYELRERIESILHTIHRLTLEDNAVRSSAEST
jgi:hypothetical protein